MADFMAVRLKGGWSLIIRDSLLRRWAQLHAWLHSHREFRAWRAELPGRLLTVSLGLVLALFAVMDGWGRYTLNAAQRQAHEGESQGLAATANLLGDGRPEMALLLGLQAIGITDTSRCLHASAGHTDRRLSVAFSPNGAVLATAGHDQTVQLWDVASRQPLGDPLTGHTGPVYSIAFSPNGAILATASDQTVQLWDVASRQPLGDPLTGHTGPVYSIAFSPNGTMLATASDQTVQLWDVASRQPLGDPLTGQGGNVPAENDPAENDPARDVPPREDPPSTDPGFAYVPWGPDDAPIPGQYAAFAASASRPPDCDSDNRPPGEFWSTAVAVCRAIHEGGPWPTIGAVPEPPLARNAYQACLDGELRTMLVEALRWHMSHPGQRPVVSYVAGSSRSPCQDRIYEVRVLGESDAEDPGDYEAGKIPLAIIANITDRDEWSVTVDGQPAEPCSGYYNVESQDLGDGLEALMVCPPAAEEGRTASLVVSTDRGRFASSVKLPGVDRPEPEPTEGDRSIPSEAESSPTESSSDGTEIESELDPSEGEIPSEAESSLSESSSDGTEVESELDSSEGETLS